jgi:hypothetical protein
LAVIQHRNFVQQEIEDILVERYLIKVLIIFGLVWFGLVWFGLVWLTPIITPLYLIITYKTILPL